VPTTIDGCLLKFEYVESIQSGAECILAVSSESRLIVFFLWKVQ